MTQWPVVQCFSPRLLWLVHTDNTMTQQYSSSVPLCGSRIPILPSILDAGPARPPWELYDSIMFFTIFKSTFTGSKSSSMSSISPTSSLSTEALGGAFWCCGVDCVLLAELDELLAATRACFLRRGGALGPSSGDWNKPVSFQVKHNILGKIVRSLYHVSEIYLYGKITGKYISMVKSRGKITSKITYIYIYEKSCNVIHISSLTFHYAQFGRNLPSYLKTGRFGHQIGQLQWHFWYKWSYFGWISPHWVINMGSYFKQVVTPPIPLRRNNTGKYFLSSDLAVFLKRD